MTADIYQLYSTQAPADQRDSILSIAAIPGVTQCRSRVFENKTGHKRWLDIDMNKKTGLWSIVRNDLLGKQGNIVTPVYSGVCYYDAVDYCARFESTEADFFPSEDRGPDGDEWPWYRDIAEASGIPFDSSDIPCPAVDGKLLLDPALGQRHFGTETDAIIKRTRSRTGKPVQPANLQGVVSQEVSALSSAEAMDINDIIKHEEKRENLLKQFQEAAKYVDKVYQFTETSVKQEFPEASSSEWTTNNPKFSVLCSLSFVGGGVVTLVGTAGFLFVGLAAWPLAAAGAGMMAGAFTTIGYGINQLMPGKKFDKVHDKLQGKLDDLQNGTAKDDLDKFSVMANRVFHLEYTARILKDIKNGSRPIKNLRHAEFLLNYLFQNKYISQEESTDFMNRMKLSKFQEPGSFIKDLEKQYEATKKNLNHTIAQLETRTPKP